MDPLLGPLAVPGPPAGRQAGVHIEERKSDSGWATLELAPEGTACRQVASEWRSGNRRIEQGEAASPSWTG